MSICQGNQRNLQKEGKWLGKGLFESPNLGPGLIKIEEITAFGLIALCPLLLGTLVLVLEFYSKYLESFGDENGAIINFIVQKYRFICVTDECEILKPDIVV
ncbi:unnamed protein product [Orchesella dallaii]|uniref:Uncharacterized protein n=1 Tax=Orchesella dallaii TaxID=48710 RepID=A0ABP1S945_9HEXA